MKFLEKINDNEFYHSLEKNLIKTAAFDNELELNRIANIKSLLTESTKLLKSSGLIKEAEMVAIVNDICNDEATKNLTSEKMLKNLEEKGWVFNADDMDCSEGKQPPLGQFELKYLRDIMKGKVKL